MTPSGTGGASCESIEEAFGLRCLKQRGTWEDLESYNRAAALTMRNGENVSYLVLTGLDRERVIIGGRDAAFGFERSALQPYWSGQYLLLWRAPPRGTQAITENSEGVDVLWLRQTLNRVPSLQSVELDNARFDSSLKERIRAFQRSNNLRADGMAGVHTLIRLNSIVDPDVPKLDKAAG